MDSRLHKHPGVYHNRLVSSIRRQTIGANRNSEISAQTEILQPPTAQNLPMLQTNGKYEPPRAQNLIKFDIRTIDKGNGLKFDRNHSNSQKLERLRLIHNRHPNWTPSFPSTHVFAWRPGIILTYTTMEETTRAKTEVDPTRRRPKQPRIPWFFAIPHSDSSWSTN